jgi:hypothetical protein
LQNRSANVQLTVHAREDGEDRADMEIRFISSLTAEDENAFAPALLKAVGTLLDQMPIAYTIRIETTGAQVFQHTHAAPEERPQRALEGLPTNGAKLLAHLAR